MRFTKKAAKISWGVFNIVWVVVMYIIDRFPDTGYGLGSIIGESYIVAFMFLVMPSILLLFNILYGLLYKTKNYVAVLILNIVVTVLLIGGVTAFNNI
ncbi:MAG: hypothetical protein HOE19_04480 [Candidatus Komeilibacteria bacterium]|jgi:hypothetical protein|nr:hypothetical protein [Candidatus Komeilibacteria bacterium]MBT4447930.1 hypothetical protein [Candidatus Komeilibacteria bacterium]